MLNVNYDLLLWFKEDTSTDQFDYKNLKHEILKLVRLRPREVVDSNLAINWMECKLLNRKKSCLIGAKNGVENPENKQRQEQEQEQ